MDRVGAQLGRDQQQVGDLVGLDGEVLEPVGEEVAGEGDGGRLG